MGAFPHLININPLILFAAYFYIDLYELLLSPTYRWPWKIKAICIPIEFRYDLCMTKELILRQFYDPINQMIAAIILNRVRFLIHRLDIEISFTTHFFGKIQYIGIK